MLEGEATRNFKSLKYLKSYRQTKSGQIEDHSQNKDKMLANIYHRLIRKYATTEPS